VSIAELIGQRVRLTKRGREYVGLCPFHNEKTPSFSVVEDKGLYHCFGCGAHGDVIGFLMQADNLAFPEAVERLARRAGLNLPGNAAVATKARDAGDSNIPAVKRKLESILATATRLLVHRDAITAASIVANATAELEPSENFREWLVKLSVPPEIFDTLPDDPVTLEHDIDGALSDALRAVSNDETISSKIVPALHQDPDWRRKARQFLSGEGVTNQGRVHSQNIAARQYEGLLFRSNPEVLFYDALKRAEVPFAPLPVVIRGGTTYRRIEPDFVIFKDGIVMVVEIDGDLYHKESPTDAHKRLQFLLHEGARLERIKSEECDTPEKATEAVARIIRIIDKLRQH
jgi:hypothetical protein